MRNTLKTIFSLLFVVSMLFFITLLITSKKKSITTDNTIVKTETQSHIKTK